ncbi:MAG: response regulator [Lachnospiraceae bacterium]|nr:response regulator [Lachnospiraceae bacterium]
MNTSIISLNAMSVVIFIIIIIGCLLENFGKNKRTHIFMTLCIVGVFGTISDMIPFALTNTASNDAISTVMHCITLICGIWFPLCFVYYLVEIVRNTGKNVPKWVAAVANLLGSSMALLAVIATIFGGSFKVESGKLTYGPFFVYFVVTMVILAVYCAVIITYYVQEIGVHDALPLYFYVVAPVIAVSFEAANVQISITFVSISIATLVLYIFIQTGEIRTSRMDAQSATLVAKEKSDFIARFSHELRTPINAIIGMDEIILRTSQEDETLSCANDIKSAGNTLLTIINDILDSARIESGKVDIINVSYQPVSAFKDLTNLIQSRVKSKGLQFIMDIDPNIPSKLYGDEVKVKQIITNLLTNSVKYTNVGFVKLSVSSRKKDESNIFLCVCVEDTGIGIKEEELSKLFSPFSRIDELRNRYEEGTGLGMFITQSFLKMMDSQMEVKSVYGQGSSFAFEIVQRVEDWTPIGSYEEAISKLNGKKYVYKASFVAPEAKVLIVDDNNVNITVCKRLLKDTLVKCDTATSGIKAVEMCRDKKFDLIFMDQMMPEMDGIEAMKTIRTDEDSLNVETPIVALTANASAGTRESLIEIGFNDYLSKPIEYKRLEEVMNILLPDELVEKQ